MTENVDDVSIPAAPWGEMDHGPPETPYVSGDEGLSGASRTTGGFSRGKAFGNIPNIGDEGQL